MSPDGATEPWILLLPLLVMQPRLDKPQTPWASVVIPALISCLSPSYVPVPEHLHDKDFSSFIIYCFLHSPFEFPHRTGTFKKHCHLQTGFPVTYWVMRRELSRPGGGCGRLGQPVQASLPTGSWEKGLSISWSQMTTINRQRDGKRIQSSLFLLSTQLFLLVARLGSVL